MVAFLIGHARRSVVASLGIIGNELFADPTPQIRLYVTGTVNRHCMAGEYMRDGAQRIFESSGGFRDPFRIQAPLLVLRMPWSSFRLSCD